jgi:TerC family integral membrane protein
MGTWTLWVGFNAGVAVLLLLDLGLFHRRAHLIALREAAVESAVWVALSVAFGFWIFSSHGHGLGLEFFTGYVIEKSLSVDNVFVFLLIFQFFRVDPRYQHRLLYWGVLGALILRGGMIGVGVVLIQRFEWILYLFGAFLLYAGFKLFGADHSVHPEKNPVVRWAQKILPMSKFDAGPRLFVREGGRWMATSLFLVMIVLETTDLLFAVDSIPAVFGVTRDPFIVYTSNVCAILGLRAFYFLLAGILPYFRYLDDGLAVVLMFIGAKMLADPWVHISTEMSLAVVGVTITIAVLVSLLAVRRRPPLAEKKESRAAASIHALSSGDPEKRAAGAKFLFTCGMQRIQEFLTELRSESEFKPLLFSRVTGGDILPGEETGITVGIAVFPERFGEIRAANNSALLAEAPVDQEVVEFELHFPGHVQLDILTAAVPGGGGAIARFLEKFGEGIQHVEIDVTDVDRATQILRARFKLEPIYPATRPGANGTRVNFFLVTASNAKKVLVELVEQPRKPSQAG